MMATNDPARQDYVPYYEDAGEEYERMVRCLQQQIEDCFTTMSRIRRTLNEQQRVSEKHGWQDLRSGLRCWRVAIREVAPSKGTQVFTRS